MSSIIIVFPKQEDGNKIRTLLGNRGLACAATCTTASAALAQLHQLDSGIVICSQQIRDMHYTQLAGYLPDYFELLLLISPSTAGSYPPDIMTLTCPIRTSDLVGTVEMMLAQMERRLKKKHGRTELRSEKEQNYINNAKLVLMERNQMTEPDAFRYIQKCSMDSGTNMVETAQMILMLHYNGPN